MSLGPKFWDMTVPPTLAEYPSGWPERVEEDLRLARIVAFGWATHQDVPLMFLKRMIETDVIAERERMRVDLVETWPIH